MTASSPRRAPDASRPRFELAISLHSPDDDERARLVPAMAGVPIFVLSAYTDAQTRQLCRDAGANRFFTKPADVRKLDSAIKEALEIG